MKKLLNTLYVLTPESYLFCRNETICVEVGGEEKYAVPAITIDSIVCFGKMTVSTPLIGFCGKHNISLTLLDRNGQFLGRICGPVSGNILLRKKQFDSLNDSDFCLNFVRDLLYAKFRNSRMVLMKSARSSSDDKEAELFAQSAEQIRQAAVDLSSCETIYSMRGVEGSAATAYFARFDDMIADNLGKFRFDVRSRRPPRNEVNAVLSFVYMLLTRETESALESVGLDPAAGYLHTLRPGRASFALDLLEELRAPLCDRFVISLFNRGQLSGNDFESSEEAVYLNDSGRRVVLTAWQKRKAEEITHPFLEEKVQIGMIPYVQAMLFARVLRGDLDRYPPFVWR